MTSPTPPKEGLTGIIYTPPPNNAGEFLFSVNAR